jgi:hypothetical protein
MVVAVSMIVSISSCATKTQFLASSVVPAAEGTVSVKQDNNKNYNIGITIRNLAEPTRLQPAKNMYVVWMEGEDNETKNIGQIKSSQSFISKQLKGSFETVSAVRPKKIFITAENDPGINYPNYSDIILTTDYLKQK